MINRWYVVAMAALVAAATPAAAQGKSRGRSAAEIPAGQRPAAGMCRVWIDGVPPGQQPAATDCATAAARRPPNSRIIYGDDPRAVVGSSFDPMVRTRDSHDARDTRESRDARDDEDRGARAVTPGKPKEKPKPRKGRPDDDGDRRRD